MSEQRPSRSERRAARRREREADYEKRRQERERKLRETPGTPEHKAAAEVAARHQREARQRSAVLRSERQRAERAAVRESNEAAAQDKLRGLLWAAAVVAESGPASRRYKSRVEWLGELGAPDEVAALVGSIGYLGLGVPWSLRRGEWLDTWIAAVRAEVKDGPDRERLLLVLDGLRPLSGDVIGSAAGGSVPEQRAEYCPWSGDWFAYGPESGGGAG